MNSSVAVEMIIRLLFFQFIALVDFSDGKTILQTLDKSDLVVVY